MEQLIMTETNVIYLEEISAKCPSCGIVIGQYHPMPMKQTWLMVGNMILSELHGFCKCGAEFHFWYNSLNMDKIIANARMNEK